MLKESRWRLCPWDQNLWLQDSCAFGVVLAHLIALLVYERSLNNRWIATRVKTFPCSHVIVRRDNFWFYWFWSYAIWILEMLIVSLMLNVMRLLGGDGTMCESCLRYVSEQVARELFILCSIPLRLHGAWIKSSLNITRSYLVSVSLSMNTIFPMGH